MGKHREQRTAEERGTIMVMKASNCSARHIALMPRSRGEDRRGQMPDLLSIHVRPPEATDRAFPGHWEGDLIKGTGNRSAVGVLLERSSRLVMLIKLADAPDPYL